MPANSPRDRTPRGSARRWRATRSRRQWSATYRTQATEAASGPLEMLVVDGDGTVTVRVTHHLGRQLLPGAVAKFVRGDVKIVQTETWRRDGDGQVRGQVDVSASGGLGSGRA
ncbi:DUF2505 domain-containing protein, partial [Mycobacterium avium]|uniref:DUF2505 domain-containing protein n=1 Tax=Mycobacterium avium TaxID=1764 RepID=UPI0012DA75E7